MKLFITFEVGKMVIGWSFDYFEVSVMQKYDRKIQY